MVEMYLLFKRKVEKMNIEKLWDKYKDIIPYGVFGVLTTLVNIVSYWIFAHPFGLSVMVSTVLAWILSVLFAYLTNRKWVFHSEASTREEIGKEIVSFSPVVWLREYWTGHVCLFLLICADSMTY